MECEDAVPIFIFDCLIFIKDTREVRRRGGLPAKLPSPFVNLFNQLIEDIKAKTCIKHASTPIPNTPIINPFKYTLAL
jgi:hypothetical protein